MSERRKINELDEAYRLRKDGLLSTEAMAACEKYTDTYRDAIYEAAFRLTKKVDANEPYVDVAEIDAAIAALSQPAEAEDWQEKYNSACRMIGSIHAALSSVRNDATDRTNWRILIDNIIHDRDRYESQLAQLRTENERLTAEIKAVLDLCEGAVRVREGGGPENICASLAVTVSKLRAELAALKAGHGEREAAIESAASKVLAIWKTKEACNALRALDKALNETNERTVSE